MIVFLFILIAIGGVGYVYYMKIKNETFIIQEIAEIKEKPIMPSIDTSYFLSKDKEFVNAECVKIGDFTIDNLSYPNYFVGYFSEKQNVYIVLGQYLPNKIQKFLGITDMPFMSVFSVFDNGSDLESTTRLETEKENKSSFRRINVYNDLPIEMLIQKHLVKVDMIETSGINAIKLNIDDFYKHMRRGLKIDIVHFTTNGYETKHDIEKILINLGLDKKEENENKTED